MNERKMLVSDYDGTFFLDEEGIKKNVDKVNEFRKEKNLFVIATGNNLDEFQKVIEKYDIKYDYLVLDQGACIFDNKNNLLKASFFDPSICEQIMKIIKNMNKQYKICNPYKEVKIVNFKKTTKIAIDFGKDLEEAKIFTNQINQKLGKYIRAYTMIFKEGSIVEIISCMTDKNEAIDYIINKEKIKKENIYTVGNGYNDISMIKKFNGYCMKNSVNELIKECPNCVEMVSDLIDKIIKI